MVAEVVKLPRPANVPTGWSYDLEVGGVLIGTPAYGGQVHARFAWSLVETKALLSAKGIPCGWMYTESESLIQRARDRIAAQFMAMPGASHLVFIDADIEWKPADVLRLLSHDVPVVCGIYPKKCEPVEFPMHPLMDAHGISPRDDRTGKIQIASAPTGFLCIRRDAFERMAVSGVVKKIRAMQGIGDDVLPHLYDYFPVEVDDDDGILWSEDYNFCRLWRRIGGEIWMDPAIKLTHIGAKAYTGDPATIFHEIEPAA